MKKWSIITLGLFLLFFDQFLKICILQNCVNNGFLKREISFFQVGKFLNSGIAFSLPFWRGGIIFVTLIILFWLWMKFQKHWRENKTLFLFFEVLIFSGGISNLIDRIRYGFVIDYFSFFKIFSLNFADIFVVVGVFGLWLIYLTNGDKIK